MWSSSSPCGAGDLCRHPTHCSTHTGSPLGNINARRQEPNGSDLIGLAQIVPQRRRIKIYHRQIPKQRLPRAGCEVPEKVMQHLLLGKRRGRTWSQVYDPWDFSQKNVGQGFALHHSSDVPRTTQPRLFCLSSSLFQRAVKKVWPHYHSSRSPCARPLAELHTGIYYKICFYISL